MAKTTLDSLWKEFQEYIEPGNTDRSNRTYFPTGIPDLDRSFGSFRGMQSGIVEILGGEAVGKSTLALQTLATTQKTQQLKEVQTPDGHRYNAVYMDFEHTYDAKYAKTIGVDTEKLLILSMTYAQQQFQIVEFLLAEGIQFVIIDSIAVIIPMSEEEKEVTDNEKMADEAKVIGRALKRLNALAAAHDALILVINQYRANISALAMVEKKGYGAWILRYLKKATIELTRVKRADTRMYIEAFVVKNKMGAIGQKVAYVIEHGKGIQNDQHIFSLAIDYDIITRNGAWYMYDTLRAQGETNALALFPMDHIRTQVLTAMEKETL